MTACQRYLSSGLVWIQPAPVQPPPSVTCGLSDLDATVTSKTSRHTGFAAVMSGV